MPATLKDEYLKITNDQKGLTVMHNRDRQRMVDFKDWPDSVLRSIQAYTLLINGDKDIVRPEHAAVIYRLIPHSRLAILPAGHRDYIGELSVTKTDTQLPQLVVLMIEEFLYSPRK